MDENPHDLWRASVSHIPLSPGVRAEQWAGWVYLVYRTGGQQTFAAEARAHASKAMETCDANLLATVATLGGLLLLLIIGLLWPLLRPCLARRFGLLRLHSGEFFRIRGSDALPTLPLVDAGEYHLFMSHTWRTGKDQPTVVKRHLQSLLPHCKLRIFLDVYPE